ncbi:MAG TPA: MerR family transcriptional regulator, partial [Acidimicrobiales bacterium]
MADRSHLSIGEVLSLLQDDFPDVTISKIRFLESQGLLDPERTPSGYRKFYEADIERLRWILRHQRDHFLPLKVMKDRLEEAAAAGLMVPPDEPASPAASAGPAEGSEAPAAAASASDAPP